MSFMHLSKNDTAAVNDLFAFLCVPDRAFSDLIVRFDCDWKNVAKFPREGRTELPMSMIIFQQISCDNFHAQNTKLNPYIKR